MQMITFFLCWCIRATDLYLPSLFQENVLWLCAVSPCKARIVTINVLYSRLHREEVKHGFMNVWKLSTCLMACDLHYFNCPPTISHASTFIAVLKLQIKFLLFSHLWLLFSTRLVPLMFCPASTHGVILSRHLNAYKIQCTISHPVW